VWFVTVFALTRHFSWNRSRRREEALPLREENCGALVASSRASHAVAAAPSFQAYLCTCKYMLYVCVYICVCMCVYEQAYMYISACVYV